MRRLSSTLILASLGASVVGVGGLVGGFAASAAGTTSGTVSGTVFRDLNANGAQDVGEPGEAATSSGGGDADGLIVTAVDADGDVVGSAVSGSDGFFSIDIVNAESGQVRVEFTGLPTYLREGPIGVNNASSVQFVTMTAGEGGLFAGDVDLGVLNPADYCQDNPDLVTNCFGGGPQAGRTEAATKSFPSTASGINAGLQSTISELGDVGSVYGVAYQRSTGRLFVSTFLKRHAEVGPGGLDAIYRIDTPGAAPVAQSPVNTDPGGLYAAVPARALDIDGVGGVPYPSIDPDVFPLVMKVGYGDLDMGEDDATLWTTNLGTREVVRIPVAADGSFGAAQTYAAPDAALACVNGVARPFGLTPRDGLIYVGFVCTAELGGVQADLSAHVLALDPATGTWSASVLDIPLDYPKGFGITNAPDSRPWFPWIDSFETGGTPNFSSLGSTDLTRFFGRPMPVVSDLAFSPDGSLSISFRDRSGDMLGYRNLSPNNDPAAPLANMVGGTVSPGGDLLRAAIDPASGALALESNGALADGRPGSGVGNNQGPGGGEFYGTEACCTPPAAVGHEETITGGILKLSSSSSITAISFSPVRLDSAGVKWFDQDDGSITQMYELTVEEPPPAQAGTAFEKANGLGDLEAMCNRAPVEIGNRVWIDTDADGVQDAAETPVAGVTVSLYLDADGNGVADGPAVATATTDAGGVYVFSSDPTRVSDGAHVYDLSVLSPGARVIVGVPTTIAPGGVTHSLTTPNLGGSDTVDSDAAIATGLSTTITIGNPGDNDHRWDFGYVVPYYDLALIKTRPLPAGNVVAVGGDVTWTITVANQGQLDSGAYTVLDRIPGGMVFVSASDGGTHANGVVTWNLTGLTPGTTRALTLVTRVTSAAEAPYRNWSEITTDSGDDIDSIPDTDTGNDPGAGIGTPPNDQVTNHNDISFNNNTLTPLPGGALDEDDNDYEEISVTSVLPPATTTTLAPSTTRASSGQLPSTGGGAGPFVRYAMILTLGGIAMLLLRRARRWARV